MDLTCNLVRILDCDFTVELLADPNLDKTIFGWVENGVLAFENVVLAFEKVALAFENGVLAFENGVLAFEN